MRRYNVWPDVRHTFMYAFTPGQTLCLAYGPFPIALNGLTHNGMSNIHAMGKPNSEQMFIFCSTAGHILKQRGDFLCGKNSVSGKKILVRIRLLILGYFVSMAIGMANGNKLKQSLIYVSDTLFIDSQESKAALTEFKDQIKIYNDAIMMGDKETVASAQEKGELVIQSLDAILKLDQLDAENTERVSGLERRIQVFSTKAETCVS